MVACTIDAILSSLSDFVGDQLQVVTFKWLARHYNIPYDTSKRILFEFLARQGQKVKATFLLSGWTAGTSTQHVVRVVESPQLEAAKAQLAVITALHVYSVQPALTKDAADLHNADFLQAEQLFRKLLASPTADAEANPLAANLLSAVQCAAARRDPALAAAGKHQPAGKPTAAAAVLAKPAAMPDALAQEVPSKQAVKEPSTRSSPAGKGAMQKMWAKAPAKVPAKQPAREEMLARKPVSLAAPRGTAATVAANEGRAGKAEEERGGEAEEEVMAKRRGKGSKGRMIEDSDSDDDLLVPPPKQAKREAAPALKQPKPAAPRKKSAAAGGSDKRKRSAADDHKFNDGAVVGTGPAAKEPAAQKLGRTKLAAAAAGDEGKRRVMRTYFNDAGEEVTELAEAQQDDAMAADVEAAVSAPAEAPMQAAQEQQADELHVPNSNHAPSVPPAKGAGGKKQASSRAAAASGSRNIMSFFGKK